MSSQPIVHIVDNDEGVLRSLGMLMEAENLAHQLYGSAQIFLQNITTKPRGCLVLDIRMPNMNGLQLQEELLKREIFLPILFISAHADIATAVRAMQYGALDVISKPFIERSLLNSIAVALEHEENNHRQLHEHEALLGRLEKLSKREEEVFNYVAEGWSNKKIARQLDLSERTIECHRSQVIKKMAATSLADLVRMRLEIKRPVTEPLIAARALDVENHIRA